MSTNSAIEWTEATWNALAGCTPNSPGCLNCYAAKMSNRLEAMGQSKYAGLTVLRNGVRTFNGKINFDEAALSIPLKRKKPTMYFVNSMSDLFHEDVPWDYVDKVFAVMALCPQHTFQVLTKRPARMADYTDELYIGRRMIGPASDGMWSSKLASRLQVMNAFGLKAGGGENQPWKPFPNVWLGCSPVNQKTYDEYRAHMQRVTATVRFYSLEPLLGPIDLGDDFWESGNRVEWVIVGGESGPNARPCNIDWVRDIVRQCREADVPVFVKQLGSTVVQRCTNCGKMTGNCMGGMVDSCGPGHAQFAAECFRVHDSKGGDPDEWPEALRVREMPAGGSR